MMKGIKRRTFIFNTIAAGIGTSVLPVLPEMKTAGQKTQSAASKKIIVAGAGITGLCCAYELMKNGHDVTVLEATGRYGGHIFTGRDGLSDGLYADYGADHMTKPGYEHFFAYAEEFQLPVLAYPHAEGSDAAPGRNALRMIDGKFYSEEMLKTSSVLTGLGFNQKEADFLDNHKFYDLPYLYLGHYLDKFKDPDQPYGVGYDEFDKLSAAALYQKEGASVPARKFLGGETSNALYVLWRMAQMGFRGIPPSEGDTYRLQGGNEQLPIAFAKRLGDRVKLNHPIQSISRNAKGITVKYRAYGRPVELDMDADVLVNCIPLPVFKKIPVTPAFSPEKQYVIDNLRYSSHPFFVFEAASRFWLNDGLKSINMEFEHPDISSIWEEPNEIKTNKIILKAYGPGGISAQRVLAAFRQVYPGKQDTIETAITRDWTTDRFSPACEMEPFAVGEMKKFWPQIMQPEGNIYFAGTYADAMSRGMESCIRSAQRVAKEIHHL